MNHCLAGREDSLERTALDHSGYLPRVLIVLALVAALPTRGDALGNTCNASISIAYPNVSTQTATHRVRITLETGPIQNGTKLTLSEVHFDLACRHKGCSGDITRGCTSNPDCVGFGGACMLLLSQNCVADTMTPGTNTVAAYVGNITTTCGTQGNSGSPVTWTATTPVSPNEIVFTASTPIAMPPDNSAVCNLEFDIKQLSGQSYDDTPQTIEERAGFEGQCDNSLGASPENTGSVDILKETFTGPPPLAAPAIGSPSSPAFGLLAVALALAGVVLLDVRTRRRTRQ